MADLPLTHGRVLKIAIPIVLANVTVPILGAVDTGVVGQMGQAAPIGAVGLGAVIISMIYWIFGFLRMGTTGLVAQARGASEENEVIWLLTRALIIGLSAGVLLIALQIPLFAGGFALAPASAEVESLAQDYLSIRIWSAPAAIGIYGLSGWMIALERTRQVLWLQLWINGLNIVLDLWFVLGLNWGVGGVATATFIAEYCGFALGLYLCRDAFAGTVWRAWAQVFDRARLWSMAVLNGDILIRSVILHGIFASFTFYAASFGDVTLAANQILIQFLEITAFGLDGFAFAAEALVGQAMGARNRHALRRSAWMASFWGFWIVCALSAAFAIFGPTIIDIMTTAPDVRAEARTYLWWMAAAPLVGLASWMLDGIFIGATRSRDMRNMMILSALIYLGALLLLVPPFGNHGLWAALLISFVARGVTLALRYPALEAQADNRP